MKLPRKSHCNIYKNKQETGHPSISCFSVLFQRHSYIIDLGQQFLLSVMEQKALVVGKITRTAITVDELGAVTMDGQFRHQNLHQLAFPKGFLTEPEEILQHFPTSLRIRFQLGSAVVDDRLQSIQTIFTQNGFQNTDGGFGHMAAVGREVACPGARFDLLAFQHDLLFQSGGSVAAGAHQFHPQSFESRCQLHEHLLVHADPLQLPGHTGQE